jgi:large subunit ribosomal protein L21
METTTSEKTVSSLEIAKTGAFAVIETGGKQYIVSEKMNLYIEKLESAEGETVDFDKVLLMVDESGTVTIGTPYIVGASISASVEKQGKGKKLRVIHFKSKSNRHKTYGHRQPFTAVKIAGVKK